jgi:hypothetical protein
MIGRRHVFHIGGYDPIVPETQLARLRRSLSSFQKTWGVSAQAPGAPESNEVSSSWSVQSSGPNWSTGTRYEMLRWDDLILADHSRHPVSRLAASTMTLIDWIITGTLFRFIKSSWKYSGFFLFPYLWVTGFALLGAGLGFGVTRLAGLHGAVAWITGAVITLLVFAGMLRWLGWKKPINHVFDDWIFSRQYVYGRRPLMDARVDQFAKALVARARANDAEEIVVVGHCLGAALVMETVSRALKLDPDLARHGPTICVLTVGATIPKFALHPAGARVRAATQDVAAASEIRWAEYHARDDAISFYRFDPVTLKRVGHERGDGRPNIRRVQMHTMMDPASFKRHRFNFMRMHYQMVMGNDQRSQYDYCMVICGPLPFDEITAPDGGVGRFGTDGALLTPDVPLAPGTETPATGASVHAA